MLIYLKGSDNMNIKEALAKREELNYELIEAANSKEITKISSEIMAIENEIELSTGKTIEEVESEYVGA